MNPRFDLRQILRGITLSGAILSSTAQAWWDTGHSALCDAALLQVSPSTRNQIEALLIANQTADEGYPSFGSQCVWADDIKSERPETGPWHYLNIPPQLENVVFTPRPAQGDILTALERYLPVLADEKAKPAARLEALRYVGHFVGDLHQPMHLAYEEDWGGNKYRLTLSPAIKAVLHESERDHTNMHAVWDGYLLLYAGGVNQMSVLALISQPGAPSDGNYIQWANESLAISRSQATQYATEARLTELTEDYLAANGEVALSRLRLGATRLAALLDQAFSPSNR